MDDISLTVACSMVATRFDYCNALLCGTPEATLDKHQRVQNNMARVVCQRGWRTDAGLMLRSLHWLPVRQWVTYRMALTAHKVRATATTTYLSNLAHAHAPARALRSSDASQMVVPWSNTDLAQCTFDVAGSQLHPSGTPCLLNFNYATKLHSYDT